MTSKNKRSFNQSYFQKTDDKNILVKRKSNQISEKREGSAMKQSS